MKIAYKIIIKYNKNKHIYDEMNLFLDEKMLKLIRTTNIFY